MAIAPQRIVPARLKKWVSEELWNDVGPESEKWAYYRILCGNTYSNGQQCGHVLGYADLADLQGPISALSGGFAYLNLDGGDLAYAARAEDGAAAIGLRVTRQPYRSEVSEAGDKDEQDFGWIALHHLGYRWVEKGGYFDILRKHKYGLSGQHTARRPLAKPLAAKIEAQLNRADPGQPSNPVTLSVERGVLGDTPLLPARIRCPRCSTPQWSILNDVRPPTLE